MLRKVEGEEILRRVEEHGVTLMCAAPAVIAAVLDQPKLAGNTASRYRAGEGG